MISLHNNEKKINLYVFREKPNVDIATPGSQSVDESGSNRKKRVYTVSGFILSSQISIAHHLQYIL
jgi:hypothetical protein